MSGTSASASDPAPDSFYLSFVSSRLAASPMRVIALLWGIRRPGFLSVYEQDRCIILFFDQAGM